MNENLEKLNQEIAKTEAKLRRAEHKEKMLECNAALYSRRKKHFIFDGINTITALSFR